jgi:hypothetical protein
LVEIFRVEFQHYLWKGLYDAWNSPGA